MDVFRIFRVRVEASYRILVVEVFTRGSFSGWGNIILYVLQHRGIHKDSQVPVFRRYIGYIASSYDLKGFLSWMDLFLAFQARIGTNVSFSASSTMILHVQPLRLIQWPISLPVFQHQLEPEAFFPWMDLFLVFRVYLPCWCRNWSLVSEVLRIFVMGLHPALYNSFVEGKPHSMARLFYPFDDRAVIAFSYKLKGAFHELTLRQPTLLGFQHKNTRHTP